MSEKKGRGRPQKYPWDVWGNGQFHMAHKGKDFDCSLVSFRALVHRTANEKYGVKAKTELDTKENKITFRFVR